MVSTDRCVCRTEDGRILEGWKLVVLTVMRPKSSLCAFDVCQGPK